MIEGFRHRADDLEPERLPDIADYASAALLVVGTECGAAQNAQVCALAATL